MSTEGARRAMSDWNERYSKDIYNQAREPCTLLIKLLPDLPRGRALDIACGEGRNAIFLAKNGYKVDGVDGSIVAIEKARKNAAEAGTDINFVHADLEGYRIAPESYDLIINFYYLQRSLVPAIKEGLSGGGAILFETYTVEQSTIGHPRNPDYLLERNELLVLFYDLHITFYREGIFSEGGTRKAIASLAAKKP